MIRPGNAAIFAIGESGPGGLGVVLLTVVAVLWTTISGEDRSAGSALVAAAAGRDVGRIDRVTSGWGLLVSLRARVGRDGDVVAGAVPFGSAADGVEDVGGS